MHSRLFQARQWTHRFIKYLILRPKPWQDEGLRGANVVVVGSAPVATKPVGLDDSYRIVTINASQHSLRGWDVSDPYATIMMFNQIDGTNTNASEVRRVLSGERTGNLYLMLWRHGRPRAEAGLKAMGYSYANLTLIDRYRRVALVRTVTGELNFELDASTKYSNGIIAVLLALHSGARAVILSGINPNSTGHVYNAENLERKHVGKDSAMLKQLMAMGMPIYTADPAVAGDFGLPLWKG